MIHPPRSVTEYLLSFEGPPTPEDISLLHHARWHALATALGYNELAKMEKDLDAKDYCRMMRDDAVEELLAIGGNGGLSPFATEEYVLELPIPDLKFRLRYRKSDIEAMRLVVAKHDLERA